VPFLTRALFVPWMGAQAHAKAVTDTLQMKINTSTKHFKDVLLKRTDILKTKRERRERLTGPASQFQSSSVKDGESGHGLAGSLHGDTVCHLALLAQHC